MFGGQLLLCGFEGGSINLSIADTYEFPEDRFQIASSILRN
jgi:hypothetical protein